MKTEEGNKIIAELMGAVHDGFKYFTFPDGTKKIHDHKYNSYDSQLRYHTSWDWLMPVVEKIENLDFVYGVWNRYSVKIEGYTCSIHCHGKRVQSGVIYQAQGIIAPDMTKIKATWEACVEFIQWYNKRK